MTLVDAATTSASLPLTPMEDFRRLNSARFAPVNNLVSAIAMSICLYDKVEVQIIRDHRLHGQVGDRSPLDYWPMTIACAASGNNVLLYTKLKQVHVKAS